MENTILILIKMISAMYFNKIADEINPYINVEIHDILKDVKIDNRGSGLGTEDAAMEALRYTTEWMVNAVDAEFTKENLLQRLTLNLHGNNEYIDICTKYLDIDIDTDMARKRVTEIMSELRFEKKRNKIRQLISKANAKLNFGGEYVNTQTYITELMAELENLHSSSSNSEVAGLLGKIDFSNLEEIEQALVKSKDAAGEEGMLNTGLQGLNKACGGDGIPRGAMVNFGALTHHYKSGELIDLAMNIPIYNDPWMWDPSKKPLILRISFENTVEQDIAIMYKKLYEIKYQERCMLTKINIGEAIVALNEHFEQRGYYFELRCYDPNNFTIYDLFDVLTKYIDNGFEIHVVICDYLAQIAENTIGDRKDVRIQKTFEMARIFCYPKGITFITAHQLSTAAQELSKDAPSTFVKKVCTGGWYMDCKSLHTKLDLEFVMHIVNHFDGTRYLTVARGKHRGGENTPIKDQYFMYKFEEFGGIVPDIGGESRAIYQLPKMVNVEDGVYSGWTEENG